MDDTEHPGQCGYYEDWVSFVTSWVTYYHLSRTNEAYSFVSRINPRSTTDHVILGVLGYKPRDFASQMNLNLGNGWGIVRTIIDMVMKMEDGKYVIVKDPNKSVIRLYAVPSHAFEEDESVVEKVDDGEGEA